MEKIYKTIYYAYYNLSYIIYDLFMFGKLLKTKKEAEKRMKICNHCNDLNIVMNKFKMCKECNCYMPLKTKLDATSCPKEYW